ncbi:MAG TPA: A24 family peptidase [Advenella sp.]|nr:A24 family peptidase [Advenella sp.]
MGPFMLSVLAALSLWPAYALLGAILRRRYGRVAVADCIVTDDRAFTCMRLLVTGIAAPVFLHLLVHGRTPHWLAFFYLLALLSLSDMHMRLLPDYLLMLLLAIGLVALVGGLPQMPALHVALPAFVATAIAVMLCMAAQADTDRPALAAGDLKLIAVLTLWFPYNQLPMVLFVASFAGLVYILVIRCTTGVRLQTIAFGPCLALGALAVHVSCDCLQAENGGAYCITRPGAARPALFFTGVGVVQDRSDRGNRFG